MKFLTRSLLPTAGAASLAAVPPLHAQVLAFPGAEGFGRFATGARQSMSAANVYHVTNLNDSGAGSFRDAVSASNRYVVFDVGGIVNIGSVISVKSNITIAGQTAPGGISIYGDKVSFTNANRLISRHLAIRKGNAGDREDTVSIARGSNMIFDHMSVTWGVDETFSMNPDSGETIDNISIQNTIIGQGLDRLGHSAGGLMTINNGHFSIIKSLFTDCVTRNPKVRGNNEFINNVVYGYETAGYIMGDTSATSNANVEGNYFIEGPVNGSSPFASGTSSFHIYARDNWVDADKDGVLDGGLNSSYPGADVVTTRHAFPTTAALTAQQAVAYVLANSGLSITRDAVDTRILQEVASYGTLGGVIDRETDLFPGYGSNPVYVNFRGRLTDTDGDAMPDNWETAHGSSPTVVNVNDWRTVDGTGYTRLEKYLNEIGADGTDKVWSAASGSWATAATWSGGLPNLADEAFVRGTGAGTNGALTLSTPGAFARRLYIGGNGAAAGEKVTVATGGTLDVFDTLQVGHQNNGTLEITGGTVAAGRVLLGAAGYTGTLTLTGGTLQAAYVHSTAGTIAVNGYTGAFSGAISGVGALTKTGAGTFTVTGNNSFTGNITVSGGTLASGFGVNALNPVTGGLGNPKTAGRTVTVNNGGILSLNLGNTFGNAASTPQVTTIINQGGVVRTAVPSGGGGGGGDATTFGNLLLNGGTLTAGNGFNNLYQAVILAGTVTVGGTAASTINTNASNTTANGVMLGSNTVFNVADVTGSSIPSLTVSARLTWQQGSTTGGGLTKTGAGAMLLATANDYTGNTSIGTANGAGVLCAAASGALGTGTIIFDPSGGNPGPTSRLELINGITLANSITLHQRNNTSANIRNVSGSNTLSGPINLNLGGSAATIQSDAGLLTLSGNIATTTAVVRNLHLGGTSNGLASGVISNGSGTVNVTKQGAGTWTLSGANTYTGTTTVNAGTLSISQAVLADAATVNVAAAAVLDLTHGATDTVGRFFINGVEQAAGTWGSLTSTATYKTARITGSGILLATNGAATSYSIWASSFGLDPLTDGAASVDNEPDGFANGTEYILGGSPVSGGNNPKTYPIIADSSADGDALNEQIMTIAVPVGISVFSAGAPTSTATFQGFGITVRGSSDLISFPVTVIPVNPVVTGLPPAPVQGGITYEYRSFSLSGSNDTPGKGFLQVMVTHP